MTSRPLRRPLLVGLGALAILTGGIWMGQGLDIIPGSFMTGDPTWFAIGAVVALVGLLFIFVSLNRTKRG